ncbi:hypothetical protein RF11_09208 [Thelohanellus kitauei]|uniref:Uncharacterized protein n=1 Tax=Thelohanellus kitauei TaxID=669202 RepID=A0A0C2NB86_THEKT|nr:hypothetical protein RF11_09208 [Thelohanellus kitauei]
MIANPMVCASFSVLIWVVYTQERAFVNEMELNVVVIGDIGIRAPESVVKQKVVRAIELQHQDRPFRLGINLVGNEYPDGSAKDEFVNLCWIFELSFPASMFPFDFLTVPGAVDYQGDVATQIKYHWQEHRFYMPQKN